MLGTDRKESKKDIKGSPSGVRLTGTFYSLYISRTSKKNPGLNKAGDFLLYEVVGISKSQQRLVCSTILWDSVNSSCDTKGKADRQRTC